MIKVIDISHHQQSYNARQAVAQGIKHLICRAGYGTTKDAKADAFALNALEAGQELWAYGFATWHYDSINGKSVVTARQKMQEQAAAWVAEAKARGVSGYLVLDQELEKGKTMSLTKTQNTQLINEAMNIIRAGGFEPLLYASASWLLTRVDLTAYTGKVWVARYYWDPNDKDFADRSDDIDRLKAGQYTALMKQLRDAGRLAGWQWGRIGYGSKYGVGSANVDKNFWYLLPEEGTTGPVQVSAEPMFITIGPASAGDVASITRELDARLIPWENDGNGLIVTRVACSSGDQAKMVEMAVNLKLPIQLTATDPLAEPEKPEGYTVIFMAAVVKGGFESEADARDYIESILGADAMEKLGIEIKLLEV